ncbi:MAG: bifunctional oligoribonuclease/PAP phosphatase NrnA [Deltaproteobacteria bacterium]|nr:bifunctional oligoribonuclease/PAP phosphatase NrnA [Deltaproteobacteria bacterium]
MKAGRHGGTVGPGPGFGAASSDVDRVMDGIIAVIDAGRVFLVTSHVRPDGDAIGSSLAVYHVLRRLGKEAVVYIQDKIPDMYRFLPGSESIVHRIDTPDRFDTVFLLDCSEMERIGEEYKQLEKIRNIINIDHHLSNDGFTPHALIDVGASSTGEILCRLIKRLGVAVTKEIAVNVYTALMTDTGSFRYSNTGSGTLRLAAEMIERGADPRFIAEHVYETIPLARIRLLQSGLRTLRISEDGTIGSMEVTRKMLADEGALPEHTEGMVDMIRSIEGVVIAVLYQEMPDGRIKASLRSKGTVNVERIARTFGGGGHLNASACMIEGDMAEAKKKMRAAMEAE